MGRLLYVPISDAARVELHRRADQERRRPQDEAAILIERALGLRPGEVTDPAREVIDACSS